MRMGQFMAFAVLMWLRLAACRPQQQASFVALVPSPPPPPSRSASTDRSSVPPPAATVSEFSVNSEIRYRYARTHVESYVKNAATTAAQEVTFSLILPQRAFISHFEMEIDDARSIAEVERKAEAAQIYDEAAAAGQTAGLVEEDARNANHVRIRATVEPSGKARFKLVYEELLERDLGRYEHVIHVNPGQAVPKMEITVNINESLPVTNVWVPAFKTSNEIDDVKESKNELAEIERVSPSEVRVKFLPSIADQTENGLNGQFIVQYDVDRSEQKSGGEVQILDGYFVHFFAPDKDFTESLPKHIVFVLDVSGSMHGEKLDQTKDAMVTILDELSDRDYFNILTFSHGVSHWKTTEDKMKEGEHQSAYNANRGNLEEALTYILSLRANGGTNIHDALLAALDQIKMLRQEEGELSLSKTQSMVVFLTDGEATSGVTASEAIRSSVKAGNAELEVPIYGLAFGKGADFGLVKAVSAESGGGFARKIYEGSDAAIQLEDFYRSISSPLLSKVHFDYVGLAENNSLTKTSLNTYNSGKEFIVAGKLDAGDQVKELVVNGLSNSGFYEDRICFRRDAVVPFPDRCLPIPPHKPQQENATIHQNFIERLWAFLTIEQLLEDNDEMENSLNATERATDLALKYNFVTPLTSLVVLKTNGSDSTPLVVNLEPAISSVLSSLRGGTGTTLARSFSPASNNWFMNSVPMRPPMRRGPAGPSNLLSKSLSPPVNDMIGSIELAAEVFKVAKNCSGQLTLYPRTYLRPASDGITLDDSESDLNNVNFDNAMKSLKVVGDCCWKLFSEANFTGDHQIFREGEFKSPTKFPKLLNKVSSVQRMQLCS